MPEDRNKLIERFKDLWSDYKRVNEEIQETLSWHRRNGGRLEKLNELRHKAQEIHQVYTAVAEELWRRL